MTNDETRGIRDADGQGNRQRNNPTNYDASNEETAEGGRVEIANSDTATMNTSQKRQQITSPGQVEPQQQTEINAEQTTGTAGTDAAAIYTSVGEEETVRGTPAPPL